MAEEEAPTLRVLVIDPLAGQAALARGMLESLGHRVMVAHDWPTAETLLTLHAFDAVVMSATTPGATGGSAAAMMRAGSARWSALPLVGVGAGVHRRDAVAARAAGFDALVPRPFGPQDLAAALQEAVRLRTPLPLLDPPRRDALRQSHGPAALAARDEGTLALAAQVLVPLLNGPASRAETHDAILAVAEAMESVGAAQAASQARRLIEGGPRAMRGVQPLLQVIVASRFALRTDRMNAAQADPIWAASDISPGDSP